MGLGILGLLGFSASAGATMWEATMLLNGTNNGFGFSTFHDSSGSNVMAASTGGTSQMHLISATFDDVTGAFFMDVNYDNNTGSPSYGAGSATLSGILNFDNFMTGSNFEMSNQSDLFMTNPGDLFLVGDATLSFLAGIQCCGGATPPPNSYLIDTNGDLVMSLWGADGYDPWSGEFIGSKIGMDLRLKFSAVPEPSLLGLIGLGLMFTGYSFARRK